MCRHVQDREARKASAWARAVRFQSACCLSPVYQSMKLCPFACTCCLRPKRVSRDRDLDNLDDLHFGVHEEMMYALNTPPLAGAQWTGIVTQIAISMLESGKVEAVVCVQSDEHDRFSPKPVRCCSVAQLTRLSGAAAQERILQIA